MRSGSPTVVIPTPDEAILRLCARPARITADADTQAEQERLWRRDRLNLASCADRHALVVGYIRDVAEAVNK